MEYQSFFLVVSCLLPLIMYAFIISSRRNSRLPPGPKGFPIIGNLLEFGDKPHQSLAILSKRYGPLMSLKLASNTTVVISSPGITKEFFSTHDVAFLNRSAPKAIQLGDYHKYSIVWMEAGDQWRKLRRMTKEYLFCVQQLDASELLRREKVQDLVNHVNQCCIEEKPLNVGACAFTTALNILSNFMFSVDLAQYDPKSTQEFQGLVLQVMQAGAKPGLLDLFPILHWLDPLELIWPENAYAKKMITIFDKIINDRLQNRSNGVSTKNDDVLDLLLNQQSSFTQNDMRHLFLTLFVAGTDTTSSTLEWAMSELIRNPEKMKIARLEVDKLMQNNNNGSIQESDISQLTYLQAVIKETLRLHPPAPFLIPRQAMNDVAIQGFIVPKNAQILCNVWAMGRDPNIWSDP
ncbi:cytochrome P450 76T24 [Lactuca sativa]|uniref:cytochrome P450 76T24 n=1 Tax=Lactuca sativa TaxID=4236 RepID=UPI000CD8F631|nr:cytochrome P450 76T24 [Lactuca sativa]